MLFQDKLSDIIRTLENDGLLLHPTDTLWSLSCSASSIEALKKISKITESHPKLTHTVLIDTISHLKKYVPHLHPRIETLLHFHTKPLTIIFQKVKLLPDSIHTTCGGLAFRLVKDTYSKEIINLLGEPLVSIPAALRVEGNSKSFSELPNIVIQNADFISQHRRNQKIEAKPSVMIDYNEDGEINFLRL